MHRLLIISFDAVGDAVLPRLAARPNFAALLEKSALVRGVDSLFLTNTYPIHTSIATGVPQAQHGLINNTEPFPRRHPKWNTDARLIKTETLWQVAAMQGMTTAAVMWPVTGRARDIRWNIPELMVQPGQSQVAENLKAGSKGLQLHMFLKYRHLLSGISQPARDRFATACMADILGKKRPNLALMHLTAFDSLCHEHGVASPVLETALDAMDENLGLLLQAAGEDCAVIAFSDHAQLPAEKTILPNDLLVEMGLLEKDAEGDYLLPDAGASHAAGLRPAHGSARTTSGAASPGVGELPKGLLRDVRRSSSGEPNSAPKSGAPFFECCGGSAFFHPWLLPEREVAAVREKAEALWGFGRFLTDDELAACGRAGLPFGFAARPGWACEAYPTAEKANHGYPVDSDDYQVFFLAAGAPFAAGARATGGDLLDVAPLAAHALGLELYGMRAPRRALLAKV